MKPNRTSLLLMIGSVGLAGAAGYGTSVALGLGTAGAPPTFTTTVNVGGPGETGATGPSGPAGPAGPTGPEGPQGGGGAQDCPAGSSFQSVILNAPGGHTELWVCVAG